MLAINSDAHEIPALEERLLRLAGPVPQRSREQALRIAAQLEAELRKQPGRFAGAKDEMGQAFGPIRERPDDQGCGGGHPRKMGGWKAGR